MNNNNYNFIEQSFVNNLKLIAREVVREELQANGYAVRPDSQFIPNYDPGNMMQNIMSKAATMPDGTSVNDICIDYRRRNLKHCNTCFAGDTCLARFETKTFDVDEFNRRYGSAISKGMTVRQFFNLPEVIKFKGNRTNADIADALLFKNPNTFVSIKDIKDGIDPMDLFVYHITNRTLVAPKIVIYVNVTGFTKDDVAEPICINTSHNCNACSVVNTCPIKKAETKEEPKGKKYKDLKEFGLFDLMPNGFNLYLDDEDIVGSDDSMEAQFNYDIDTGIYSLNNNSNIKVTYDELQDCEVTCIGADADFVPTLWIKPSEEWYKKFEYSKLAAALSNVKDNKSDAMNKFFANEEKGLIMPVIAANAKPKRQYKRRRSVNK